MRNILISGAGSGLGRGLCLALAAEGHHVFATDQHLGNAKETVAMLEATGGRGSAHQLDVTSETSAADFYRSIGQQPVDVLINNAGLQHVAPLESFPQEKWDQLIDVMLKGSCLLARAALVRMREHGFGRIINIGSIHSLVASPYKSAYVAAKHGLLGLSKTIALETADTDITINTICPAYIRTPLVDEQIAQQAEAHGITEQEVIDTIMLRPMPKGQFITVQEVAAAAVFLMSNAARNITGQTIVIDGGWTIQ